MATMKELLEFQKDFDKRHGWYWGDSTDEKRLRDLQYATIAITGEIGEFANVLKKALREFNRNGKVPKEVEVDGKSVDINTKLAEELADVFVYTLKISVALGIDLEKEYFEKMRKNETRFGDFVV